MARLSWLSPLGKLTTLDVVATGELPDGFERVWCVNRAGSAVHRDGDTERFGHFVEGRAASRRAASMRRDAAVTLLGDGDGERDQLLGLASSAPAAIAAALIAP
jgi:hypothetical protein